MKCTVGDNPYEGAVWSVIDRFFIKLSNQEIFQTNIVGDIAFKLVTYLYNSTAVYHNLVGKLKVSKENFYTFQQSVGWINV